MTEPGRLFERVRDRLAVRPLVLLLDVDGTLSPIAPTPEAATVPEATRAVLAELRGARGVHVVLVSGRAAADALRMVGIPGIAAIGNHGFEFVVPSGPATAAPKLEPLRAAVARAAADTRAAVARIPGTRLEDKRWTLSVHYREGGDAAGAALRPELERVAASHQLRLTGGKMVFELRPPVEVDKGTASLRLLDRLLGQGGAALYAGDDRTDEDAFAALRSARPAAVTIRIAPASGEAPAATAAEFLLPDVDAMRAFLVRLADEVRGPVKG